MTSLRVLLRALHLLFPQTCVHCREDLPPLHEDPVCRACFRKLERIPALSCRSCGVPLLGGGAHCAPCRDRAADPQGLKLLRAPFLYNNTMKSIVHAMKYLGRKSVAAGAGRWMADYLKSSMELPPPEILVPVPLHRRRHWDRGYNQAFLLARTIADQASVQALEALERTRPTRPQFDLHVQERLANVQGAFVLRNGFTVRGRSVLLVDDVATTGATLKECAGVLRREGAADVNALVLARQVLRPGSIQREEAVPAG